MIRRTALLLAAALLAGCAHLGGPVGPADTAVAARAGAEVAGCQAWFERLNAAIDRHGVRDVEAQRIAGFAGLRTDRFAAVFREPAATTLDVFTAWLARLQQLDRDGRRIEIGNLPSAAFPLGGVDGADDAAAARARAERCSDAWREPLQTDAELRASLIARAVVPDRYATWQRALGLYPLLRGPFHAGVQKWEREHQARMAQWAAAPPPRQRHVAAAPARSAAELQRLWQSRPRDALGLPQFTPEDTAALLAAYAPALEIETATEADRFGALEWGHAIAPNVNGQTPVVYQRIAATRYRGRTLLQLVYSLWFPARPAVGRFDLLAGTLDAVVLRITLAPDDGRPLMVDTVHGCGCYQLFVPTQEVRLRDGAPTDVEWAYVPATLPALRAGERIEVRITATAHDVIGIARDSGAAGRPYALRGDDELRRLPTPAGTTRSLFGPDGLVAGSERGERFLFWPMGIASAGAMRQWGQHATAFVGRRHFDDADLIERRFVIPALE